MTDIHREEVLEKQELDKRTERAHRILDCASTLILRWGYQKTTIDDIARQADVAKGTIYLHWKTREALFSSLMTREKLLFAEDLLQRIGADPEGVTLGGIARNTVLAVLKRPLMKALFVRDQDVLGKMARSEFTSSAYLERIAGFEAFLEFLRSKGLVRTDLSLRDQVFIWSAVTTGFFLAPPLMPADMALPDEDLARLMGETIRRTLEAGGALSAEEYAETSRIFIGYLRQSTLAAAEQFQKEIEAS